MLTLKGEATSPILSADAFYSSTEYSPALYLIESYFMLDMDTSYASTHRANMEIYTASISKVFVTKELFNYKILRLNYVNTASDHAQMLHNRLWEAAGNDLEARISRFVLSYIEHSSGKKVPKIKMGDLAQVINKTRTGILKALSNMQGGELIELHHGEIVTPDVENLILARE